MDIEGEQYVTGFDRRPSSHMSVSGRCSAHELRYSYSDLCLDSTRGVYTLPVPAQQIAQFLDVQLLLRNASWQSLSRAAQKQVPNLTKSTWCSHQR